jgi:hypothetical protein
MIGSEYMLYNGPHPLTVCLFWFDWPSHALSQLPQQDHNEIGMTKDSSILIKSIVHKRSLFDPLVASNIPLLVVAAAFAVLTPHQRLHAAILASSASASFLYHSSIEQHWLWLDQPLAILAFISSMLLSLKLFVHPSGGQPRTSEGRNTWLISLLFLDVAFAFFCFQNALRPPRKHHYLLWHTLWHFAIFLGQIVLLIFSKIESVA